MKTNTYRGASMAMIRPSSRNPGVTTRRAHAVKTETTTSGKQSKPDFGEHHSSKPNCLDHTSSRPADQTADPTGTPAGSVPSFLPVPEWPNYFPWPPIGGLRHLIFNAPTNGFEAAFKRIGRRVLVDVDKFWEIVETQGSGK